MAAQTLTVSTLGEGSVSVARGDGGPVGVLGGGQYALPAGAVAVLAPQPETGWGFLGWTVTPPLASGAESRDNPLALPVGDGTAVTARFMPEFHSADTLRDEDEFSISLDEMLRVIQLYNTGGYHCDSASPSIEPDGYLAGPDANYQDCFPHGSDYRPQDWRISMSELLRVVQFYNFKIIMGQNSYHFCPESGTEDSYCPGDPD